MILHCLESGSIGFESPLFPLPSRKISWAMEMYNPNVNPYRNTHPNCTKHLQKAGGVFCPTNKLEDPGDFSAWGENLFLQYCGSVHIGFPRQLRQCLLSFVQWRWCGGGRRNHAAREAFSVKRKIPTACRCFCWMIISKQTNNTG